MTFYIPATNVAFVKGDMIMNLGGNTGLATPKTVGDNFDVWFVAAETKTIAASGDPLLVWGTAGVRFIVDTAAAPTQAQMMLSVDVNTSQLLDTSAVTDQVFFCEKAVLPLTAKKVIGYFNRGVPNV